jgi:hypothetical protein
MCEKLVHRGVKVECDVQGISWVELWGKDVRLDVWKMTIAMRPGSNGTLTDPSPLASTCFYRRRSDDFCAVSSPVGW